MNDDLPMATALPAGLVMATVRELAASNDFDEESPASPSLVAALLLGMVIGVRDPVAAMEVVDGLVPPTPDDAPRLMRDDVTDKVIVGARADLVENADRFIGRWGKARQLIARFPRET